MFISSAHAFNLVQLADPAFQLWAFVQLPIAFTIGMVALSFVLYPHYRDELSKSAYGKVQLKATLFSLLLNFLVLFIATVFVHRAFSGGSPPSAVSWVIAIYFCAVFIIAAWWTHKKALALALGLPVKPAKPPASKGLFAVITLAYLALYAHIYYVAV